MPNKFGGAWTETKLGALQDYLNAYMSIMRGNERAKYFTVTYFDGFAGSGRRVGRETQERQVPLSIEEIEDALSFSEGSARIALAIDRPFDQYVFVDTKTECIEELKVLVAEFPSLSTTVMQGDANGLVKKWAASLNNKDRALVFLDPYGMQVEWTTLESLAATEKVDLWLLVPLEQAIARLLTEGHPPPEWSAALTRLFGNHDWKEVFYGQSQQPNLFGEDSAMQKTADYERITQFMIRRLQSIFVAVLEEPIVLRNRTNIPLYILCFAASNPKGGPTAIKIARDIARKFNNG